MMMTLLLGAQRYEMPLNAVGKFNSKKTPPFKNVHLGVPGRSTFTTHLPLPQIFRGAPEQRKF